MAEPVGVRSIIVCCEGNPEGHTILLNREQLQDVVGLKSFLVKTLYTPNEIERHNQAGEESYLMCNNRLVTKVNDSLFNSNNDISLVWRTHCPKEKLD